MFIPALSWWKRTFFLVKCSHLFFKVLLNRSNKLRQHLGLIVLPFRKLSMWTILEAFQKLSAWSTSFDVLLCFWCVVVNSCLMNDYETALNSSKLRSRKRETHFTDSFLKPKWLFKIEKCIIYQASPWFEYPFSIVARIYAVVYLQYLSNTNQLMQLA